MWCGSRLSQATRLLDQWQGNLLPFTEINDLFRLRHGNFKEFLVQAAAFGWEHETIMLYPPWMSQQFHTLLRKWPMYFEKSLSRMANVSPCHKLIVDVSDIYDMCIVWYNIIFHHIIWRYLSNHFRSLYHTISYYIILYHIISYYIILYHIILCYILYCIVLYSVPTKSPFYSATDPVPVPEVTGKLRGELVHGPGHIHPHFMGDDWWSHLVNGEIHGNTMT